MRENRNWATSWWTHPGRFAGVTWIAAAGLVAVVILEFLIAPWVSEHVAKSGEAALTPSQWLAIDFLIVIWDCGPQLALVLAGLVAWATWRVWVRRAELLTSKITRSLVLSGTLISLFGGAALTILNVPPAFRVMVRGVCGTNTFESAVSPNGRYVAEVAEVDCGAMSPSHRLVLVRRRPFWWTSVTLLYFNGEPSLHLSWKGRTLIASGDRPLNSMVHPPPTPMVWGGVLAQYVGPKE